MENKRFKANNNANTTGNNERWTRPQSIKQADIKRRVPQPGPLTEKRRISQTKISAPPGTVQNNESGSKVKPNDVCEPDEPGGGALTLAFRNWIKTERLESAAWMSRTFSMQQHGNSNQRQVKYQPEIVIVETVGSVASLDPSLKYLPVIIRNINQQQPQQENNQGRQEIGEEIFLAFHLLVDHPQMDVYQNTLDTISHETSSQQSMAMIKEGTKLLLFQPCVKFLESRMFHRFQIVQGPK